MTCAVIGGWSSISPETDTTHLFQVAFSVADGLGTFTGLHASALIDNNDSAAQIRAKLSVAVREESVAIYGVTIPANCIVWPDCVKT
jgi:hypothetical protein